MDAVPRIVVVGALRFERRWRNESRAADLAVLAGAGCLGDVREAERGGREILCVVLLAELVYLESVFEVVRKRFVYENALAAREHLLRLGEMLTAITGFKANHIYLCKKSIN